VFHRDYLMRIIQQVIEAIAKMMGLIEEGRSDLALKEAERGYGLLDVPKELLDIASSETLAEVLGRPDKMRLCARLLAAEASAYAASRDPLTAVKKRRTALELLLEAHREEPRDEDYDRIRELARQVPTSSLAAKYRDTDGLASS
jgi:hypothetical protein